MAAASSAKKMRRMSMKNCNKTKEKKKGKEWEKEEDKVDECQKKCTSVTKITFWLCPLHSALTMHEA